MAPFFPAVCFWGPCGLQVVLRLSSAQHVAHVGLLEGNYLSKVLGVNFSETSSVKALYQWQMVLHGVNTFHQCFFFPTCQVKVCRFYQSWPAHPRPALLCLRLCFKAPDQGALPDLNRELQSSVGTAGPQARAPDVSGHTRDLNRELQQPRTTAGPQQRAPELSGHCRTSVFVFWDGGCVWSLREYLSEYNALKCHGGDHLK